jgi:DNA modification methylase
MKPPRRSLAPALGAITTHGEPALAGRLADAWRAARGDARELTHGFHAYPARSHPRLVRALIAALSRPGDLVLDPFCGSGTTLVEAFAAGRRALGGDVNEVALRVARVKCRRTTAAERERLVATAARIARRAATAVPAGAAELPAELREWFEPHVARELDRLGRAIDEVPSAALHGALLLVLSSLLVKISRRRAETSDEVPAELPARRLARGFASRLFRDRAVELAEGLAALAAAAPRGTPEPLVVLGDARALPLRDGAARLVVTSPPYLGTYDYSGIQELRARLLSIPLEAARRREIGRRSEANAAPASALARFRDELAAALREIGRILSSDGDAVLVIGDSSAGDRRVRADELADDAARRAGLEVRARATLESRDPPRREHLIALRARSRIVPGCPRSSS